MRIRKRQVPFPLSSLSPVPLSDPLLNLNLNHPSSPVAVVQLHHCDSSPTKPQNPLRLPHVHPQPSDPPNQHLTPTGSAINDSDITDAGGPNKEEEEEEKNKQDRSELLQEEDVDDDDDDDDDDERGRVEEEKSNDIRKGSILGAEPVTGFLHESSSSPRVGRWCEGDKAFPLKKRRGSFTSSGETTSSSTSITTAADHNQKDKKMKAKMKTKMNKKCARKNDEVEEQEDQKESNKEGLDQNNNNNNAVNAKKRGRGGALMEGSRCSRVNGRGWRCCQQTLVGYSLCEHHLGKGRLRSMTSVRSRSLAGTAPSEYPKPPPLSSTSSSSSLLQEKDTIAKPVMVGDEGTAEDEEEEDEKKPLMMTKKRMKLGMVKARSISSLLGQSASTSAISVVDNNGKSLTNFTQK
ncbi:uncharacterized protein LOC107432310 isoform X2 [Ziziphus jujuba]|uniref:Uncharacterized protein LOC107432310 isoform X2 n=1 Tax=Ziziphus jujuba TaxID=326968 RepID=A0ABM3I7E7_ZIZJJ|nr:uncharacterized protein LOC107432310 isoform X2 [Ziziphus jujuba]